MYLLLNLTDHMSIFGQIIYSNHMYVPYHNYSNNNTKLLYDVIINHYVMCLYMHTLKPYCGLDL